jgi:hypothetical protein
MSTRILRFLNLVLQYKEPTAYSILVQPTLVSGEEPAWGRAFKLGARQEPIFIVGEPPAMAALFSVDLGQTACSVGVFKDGGYLQFEEIAPSCLQLSHPSHISFNNVPSVKGPGGMPAPNGLGPRRDRRTRVQESFDCGFVVSGRDLPRNHELHLALLFADLSLRIMGYISNIWRESLKSISAFNEGVHSRWNSIRNGDCAWVTAKPDISNGSPRRRSTSYLKTEQLNTVSPSAKLV